LDLGLGDPADVPFLLGMDEPYYLSTHAPPARLAPPGHQMVGVARYLHPEERPGREESETGLWQHAARAGVDRGAVVTHRYLHDMVVSGGMPLAARRGFAGRPGVEVRERAGLFLAGDWVGTTGMIGDAAAASGTAAAQAACTRVRKVAA
jgi:hypothetical protein